jgi:carboxylate-amine ligase
MNLVLDRVADALRTAEDEETVRDGVERLMHDGGGAGRQRAVAGDDLDLDAVAQDLLRRTRAGLS